LSSIFSHFSKGLTAYGATSKQARVFFKAVGEQNPEVQSLLGVAQQMKVMFESGEI